jgi:glycosyltransferase involved in cell wall biosynthesis
MKPVSSPVGVVIPTYNRAEMLREALASVLAQTVPPREIVVVDDGSTDHTAEVVAELSGGNVAVKLHKLPHLNRRGMARNIGVSLTTAPIAAFLDSDDVWLPERIERQLSTFDAAPNAGFAFCNMRLFNEKGWSSPPHMPSAADYNGHILGELLLESLAASSTLMVRREAFERVGGFRDLRMNEDYELTLRLAALYPASYVPDVLVGMRDHAGRVSHIGGDLPLLDYIRMVSRFVAERPDLPASDRKLARLGIANAQVKLARRCLRRGDRRVALLHTLRLVKARPWDRRAPGLLLRLLRG